MGQGSRRRAAREAAREAARVAAARRAKVLLGLAATAAVSWAGVVIGLLPVWVALVASTLLGAFVAALRASAKQREESARRQRRYEEERYEEEAVADIPTMSIPVRRPAPVDHETISLPRIRREPVVDSETMTLTSSMSSAQALQARENTWVPVPVPPPVYTLKPVVHRPELAPRVPAVAPDPVPAAAEEDLAPLDLDAVLQRRRAVNG